MLKAQYRLKKNYQFSYVYKKGVKLPSKYLTLIFAKTRDKTKKIGFSVSNKIGKAVVRNKVKRRLRSIVSGHVPELCGGYFYIFIARTGIEGADFDELEKSVAHLVVRASTEIAQRKKKA